MIQLLLAFQFLSRIPIRISGTVKDSDLAQSMRYYPLVGAVLGAFSVLVWKIALSVFSPNVAAVSAVVSLILASGALHLDGFADMCDGFYGGHDREKILAIMKDSRSGAMAIVGLFCLLSLKTVLLANLDLSRIIPGLILMPTLGRWAMVWLSARSTYARPEGGTASVYIGRVDQPTLLIATVSCAAIAFLCFSWLGLEVMATAALFSMAFRRFTEKRLGGMTGDTLGACCESVEVLALMVLSLHWTGM